MTKRNKNCTEYYRFIYLNFMTKYIMSWNYFTYKIFNEKNEGKKIHKCRNNKKIIVNKWEKKIYKIQNNATKLWTETYREKNNKTFNKIQRKIKILYYNYLKLKIEKKAKEIKSKFQWLYFLLPFHDLNELEIMEWFKSFQFLFLKNLLTKKATYIL